MLTILRTIFRRRPGHFVAGVVILLALTFFFWWSPRTTFDLRGDDGTEQSGPRCVDSDASDPENGIYTKGNATLTTREGEERIFEDECGLSPRQLLERWCYDVPPGSGQYVLGTQVFTCAGGCKDGACVGQLPPVSFSRLRSVTFPRPPITWDEGGYAFKLVGVSLGKREVPWVASETLRRLSGGTPDRGPVTALSLIMEIKTERPECLPIMFRRAINEAGDEVPPNNQSPLFFTDENRRCTAEAGAIYPHEEVFFVVPEADHEFIFTTGGRANIYFSVSLRDDGTITVQNLSVGEG